MTCTPEPGRGNSRSRFWFGLLGIALSGAALAAPLPGAERIAEAGAALVRGDGIAAEAELRRALEAGATRPQVAAAMGEALLDQGELRRAREWLADGRFAPGTELHGWRMRGRMERWSGDLIAAGRAYDHALQIAPKDSNLWVDIGRLRYAGGEQLQAIGAVVQALALKPDNIRALEFRAQLIRDQYGPAAALPWFAAAIEQAPEDVEVLGEYAATLGELGKARQMVAVTRKMLDLEPRNPRAFYLQAVLAARAGDVDLARSLLNRTKGRLDNVPAVMLLTGALELQAGNAATALEGLDRLARMQPANRRVELLLARTLYTARDFNGVVQRFSAAGARPDASPYLLTLLGRSYEELGRRELAAPLLDRAAAASDPPIVPIAETGGVGFYAPRWRDAPFDMANAVPYLRALLGSGQLAEAEAIAERMRTAKPGSGDIQGLAGDVQLALHRGPAAVERYRAAATVRQSDDLLPRMFSALALAGQGRAIAPLASNYLAMNPQNRLAARLVASSAAASGDWPRSRLMLENLRIRSGDNDVRLLADLSLAELRDGDKAAAIESAKAAYRLQRASPVAAQAYAMALIASGQRGISVRRLLDKAQAGMGSNPMLVQARRDLTAQ